MNIVKSDSIVFEWQENQLIKKIIDATLMYSKMMAQKPDAPSNVLSYALSSDENEFISKNIRVAILKIREMSLNHFVKVDDIKLIEIDDKVGFCVKKFIAECEINWDINSVQVLDSMCEMYIINFVMLQWALVVDCENKIANFSQQKDLLYDSIQKIFIKLLVVNPSQSYSIC